MKIAIHGYGNLGRGVEAAIRQNEDMDLVGIFTRRNPEAVNKQFEDSPIYQENDLDSFKDSIDVLMLCGGSASDLPIQSPKLSRSFNIVDSYDNHGKIPEHFEKVDLAAKEGGKLALISGGWDPGLFSMMRTLFESVLPEGRGETFWGYGVSQGHSDAVRRIPGVADARQYTVPVEETMEKVRSGNFGPLSPRMKHTRLCYVVLESGADPQTVEEAIVTMPNYFEPYDTSVHFVDQESLNRDHAGLPHGGTVLRSGKTGVGHGQALEFSIKLESNPEFTASVLLAFARAVYRLKAQGQVGAITPFDVPLGAMHPETMEALRKRLL